MEPIAVSKLNDALEKKLAALNAKRVKKDGTAAKPFKKWHVYTAGGIAGFVVLMIAVGATGGDGGPADAEDASTPAATQTLEYGQALVPNVIGKTVPDAEALLNDAGFRYQLKYFGADGQQVAAPDGRFKVVEVTPGVGEAANTTTGVTMTVESIAPRVALPDVTGQLGNEAQSALNAAGFTNLTWVSDNGQSVFDVGNWKVTGTSPAAGTQLQTTEQVTVNVTRPEASTASPSTNPDSDAIDSAGAPILAERGLQNYAAMHGLKWRGDEYLGVLRSEQQADGSWSVKMSGKLTNAAGGTARTEAEATVSGTMSNYNVTDMIIYAMVIGG